MLGINRNTLRKKITELGIAIRAHRRLARVTRLAPARPLYAIVDPLDTGRDPVTLGRALLAGGARAAPAPPEGRAGRELLDGRARRPRARPRAAGALLRS